MWTRRARATSLVMVLVVAPAFAQVPEPPPAPTARSSDSSPAPDPLTLLNQVAECMDSGKLSLEIDLQAGLVPAAPGWTVETIDAPKASLIVEGARGRVQRLDFTITEGRLLLRGNGLRPNVYVESLHFEEGKGITEARFRAVGSGGRFSGFFAASRCRQCGTSTSAPISRRSYAARS